MLARQIERVRRADMIGELVVATSDDSEDDAVATLCWEAGVTCFRGSLDDVLDRFYQCAQPYNPDHIVRLTGDCPLADPAIIDQVVCFHLNGDYDYTSNTLDPTWPDGMDVEVMRYQCLAEAHEEAELPSQREHVSSFIYQQPVRYRLGSIVQEKDISSFRLTVDEPEDFDLVSRIYERLYPSNPTFGLNDVMGLLADSSEIANLNNRFARNEGLRRSEQKDVERLGADE